MAASNFSHQLQIPSPSHACPPEQQRLIRL